MTNVHADEPFDPTHGWVGLSTHRYYDFPIGRPRSRAQSSLFARFLRGAGLDPAEGSLDEIGIQAIRFDAFIAAHVVAARGALRWARQEAARRSRIVFLLVSRGLLELDGAAPTFVSEEGGISILFPSDKPVILRARQSVELVLFSFDVSEVLPLRLNVGLRSPDNGILRSCYACLRAAISTWTPPQQPSSMVMRGLIRETARALVATAVDSAQDPSRFSQAMRVIEAEHANPLLNADRLAERLRVSRSTLVRDFHRHGTSIATALQHTRVRSLQGLMRACPDLSNNALAQGAGFGSVATMRRAVRAVRAQSIAQLRADSGM